MKNLIRLSNGLRRLCNDTLETQEAKKKLLNEYTKGSGNTIIGLVMKNQFGARYVAGLMEPGVVSYADTGLEGLVYLPMNTLNSMRFTLPNTPMYFNPETLGHPPDDVTGDDLMAETYDLDNQGRKTREEIEREREERRRRRGTTNQTEEDERRRRMYSAAGFINYGYFDNFYGMEFIDFIITDPLTIEFIEQENSEGRQVSLSSGYLGDLQELPGRHNAVEYRYVVTDAAYDHVAIVDSPRYERAEILGRYSPLMLAPNSIKGGTTMETINKEDAKKNNWSEIVAQAKKTTSTPVENSTPEPGPIGPIGVVGTTGPRGLETPVVNQSLTLPNGVTVTSEDIMSLMTTTEVPSQITNTQQTAVTPPAQDGLTLNYKGQQISLDDARQIAALINTMDGKTEEKTTTQSPQITNTVKEANLPKTNNSIKVSDERVLGGFAGGHALFGGK